MGDVKQRRKWKRKRIVTQRFQDRRWPYLSSSGSLICCQIAPYVVPADPESEVARSSQPLQKVRTACPPDWRLVLRSAWTVGEVWILHLPLCAALAALSADAGPAVHTSHTLCICILSCCLQEVHHTHCVFVYRVTACRRYITHTVYLYTELLLAGGTSHTLCICIQSCCLQEVHHTHCVFVYRVAACRRYITHTVYLYTELLLAGGTSHTLCICIQSCCLQEVHHTHCAIVYRAAACRRYITHTVYLYTEVLFLGCLKIPVMYIVYLKDKSACTILCAATLMTFMS